MNLRLIFYETTRACNMGCPHCRASAESARSPEELSAEEVRRFIDSAASFSRPVLVFSGGEPLLRPDIFDLVSYAKDAGLKPAIATNAALIGAAEARELKSRGLIAAAVSLYGPDGLSHDDFCGQPGAFEATLAGIARLKGESIPVQINTTVTKKNLPAIEEIGNTAQALGAESFHIFFLVPTGKGRAMTGDEITPEEYEAAFARLFEYQSRSPLKVKVTCAPHYYRIAAQRGARGGFTRGCLAGRGVCFISCKGEVFGCGYLPVSAGSVREQDLRTIWHDSGLFKALRDDGGLLGRCGACEFKTVCGGCRARAYAATGNYQEEEPKCVYQPLKRRS
ncbi:MAG TPA: radical SAM protein [bacterium]|nr:radical SAM protein [bacterium]